jgi:CubicO group peptidase (beta-lactamase class C family)
MQSIEELIQPYIDDLSVIGVAVALIRRGKITDLVGYGRTSIDENGVRVTPQTLFAYGSISKTICATMVMRLVESNRVDLDTPVLHYLPDLIFRNPQYGKQLTLRHLLSHTSGLPMAGKDWGPRDPDSLRKFVHEQIPYYAFLAAPGTVHHYSNTAFCIAGHVAEAVTGKYYDDLVQENVFDPLLMEHATFDPSVALTYQIALPHVIGPDGKPHVFHRLPYNASGNPSSFSLGNVSDLANLACMFLNQGNFGSETFLSESSIMQMHTIIGNRHINGAAHPMANLYQGYGLGFQIGNYKGKRVTRHGGISLSYNCFFDLFPDDQAGLILLTNYCDEERLLDLIFTLYDRLLNLPERGVVFLEKPATHEAPLGDSEVEEHRGTYLNVEMGDLATIDGTGTELFLDRRNETGPLVRIGKNQFYVAISETYRLPIAFIPNANGNEIHVMIGGNHYLPIKIDPDFKPDLKLWKLYEGIYKDPSNPERAEMFSVRVKDKNLFVTSGKQEVACKAITNYSFVSILGLIEFEDLNIDGFKILVWGKATRYFPINPDEYLNNGVILFITTS